MTKPKRSKAINVKAFGLLRRGLTDEQMVLLADELKDFGRDSLLFDYIKGEREAILLWPNGKIK